ncbi:MAG TPA: phosphotransferase [Bryobacteraceae bacterium]|jgi:hypothetical protein
MIPEEKAGAVTRGLSEAFGVTKFDDIHRMTRGLSTALVFRIVVGGNPYLLRIITRDDAMNDPTRQFACMKAACEAGLAPRVRYASIEDRISITDFVEAAPFSPSEARVRMADTLRVLHALPPFPRPTYTDVLDGFVKRFQAANLFPKAEMEEVFARYGQVSSIYPRHDSEVSCHNDLKPENVLFDGQRVWLVDWEAAFLNDRYFDLAVVANFVVTDEATERSFLERYFGAAPDEYRLARFFLMRQTMHMYYAAVFLMLGLAGRPLDLSEKVPGFRDLHGQIWSGEISLAEKEMRIVYGRVHWEQLLQNLGQKRLEEALRIVRERHTDSTGGAERRM